MYLGSLTPNVAVPIVGSDRITQGLSPTTMHVDPVSGLPMTEALAVPVAVVQPASSGVPWVLLLIVAGVAWYGWEHGWFKGLVGSGSETTTITKRRIAA